MAGDNQTDFVDTAGAVIGGIAAMVTFIAIMIAAINSVGWVIGIALGWIPACLGCGIAYALFRYLWWVLAIALAWGVLKAHGS